MPRRRLAKIEPLELNVDLHGRTKMEIVMALQRGMARTGFTQKAFAQYLQASPSMVSRAMRIQTAKDMPYDTLFRLLGKLQPQFRIMISL